jgi:hypothetical protein
MAQELMQVINIGVDGNLVLPFKLSPHASEVLMLAFTWANVVHNI